MRFFSLTILVKFLILFITIPLTVNAQGYLNGFEKSVKGEEISYHAPDPRAVSALLVRSRDATKMVQWETAPVPEGFTRSTVSFVWLFGMDVSSDQHSFTLSADGRTLLRFTNPPVSEKREISVDGKDGARLLFRITKIDRHKDVMGYAVLTLPSEMVVPGEPVTLGVQGETAGSDIWYMTFQFPVKKEISVQSQNLLIEKNRKRMQAVRIELVNLDDKKEANVMTKGQPAERITIETGYNVFQYFVPETRNEKDIEISIKISETEETTRTCTLKPVKPWYIYLVQHTHTDIGYTRSQSEILPEHLRFIDYALDYCDLTDDYPEDAKFRWTCESAWPVEQYLIRRPENQINRLLKRIKEGRIEITAMLFNMSEVADEIALKKMLEPVGDFHKRGIGVSTAMQDDVNGIGWCMADYFPDIGVNYLIMGEHGHRALIPFDKPTSFWWQSPSGKKMLAFRGEHYMYGNFLLLHTGDLENFRNNLLNYLSNLEEKDYPFDHLALQYSGYVTDNSPPAITPCKVIREWNDRYIWPKLRSATASEFMRYIEKNHGTELETLQKAWPDWWTDGFGSAARETAAIREAQTEMNITTGLLAMGSLFGSEMDQRIHQDIRKIYNSILFYDEHTFGAAESISDPYSENSMKQWAEKSSYAWEALKESRILREEAFGLLQNHVPRYSTPSISVFNTLNKERSGLVIVYIDNEIIEPGSAFSILDPSGSQVSIQAVTSRSDGTYWVLWAEDIPPLGYKSFIIKPGGDQVPGIVRKTFSGEFQNDFWSARIDPQDGSFASLIHKNLNKEMVDPGSKWKPGQLIYERLSNRHQLELFTLQEEPQRTGLKNISFKDLEEGPLWTTLTVEGTLEGCAEGKVAVNYRFYKSEPIIEMDYSIVKSPVTDPEALYVAFPFIMDDAEIVFEGQGGTIRPGIDQLAGTASDWNTVQNFIAVRTEESQMVLVSPEIPLFHLGGMNLGKFSYHHQPESSHVYSWVLNNYWTTNFKASQEGTLSWRYFLTFSDDPEIGFATDFGWHSRIPLVGRVLPAGQESGKPGLASMLLSDTPGVLLVNAAPSRSGKGIICHYREISGKIAEIDPGHLFNLDTDIKCVEVNAIGEFLREITGPVVFQPNSVHFLEFKWEP